ncbi:MAG: alpha/beta hydrolase [Candidatus Nitrosocosmicus sp.]|nr:alpha/beta hydrolase [Candidatus Nitrosocosmicus sp.]
MSATNNKQYKHFNQTLQSYGLNTILPNIILIHGAFSDGSIWHKVIPLLKEAGHDVMAVQLSLHSLADDISTVNRAIDLMGSPTLLVGHSYGGFVMTNAAQNNPSVNGLVYIAAFAPNDGESISDYIDVTLLPHDLLISDSDGFLCLNPIFFHDVMAFDVNHSEVAIWQAVQKPINQSILEAKSGPPAWKEIPSWYQISTEDQLIPLNLQQKFANQINAATISINCSHASLVSNPDKIADFILQAAKKVQE